jgi:hypothetical protein
MGHLAFEAAVNCDVNSTCFSTRKSISIFFPGDYWLGFTKICSALSLP